MLVFFGLPWNNRSTGMLDSLFCQPGDSTACSYGGVCKPFAYQDFDIQNNGMLITRVQHICHCHAVQCYKERFDPVCGDDGR